MVGSTGFDSTGTVRIFIPYPLADLIRDSSVLTNRSTQETSFGQGLYINTQRCTCHLMGGFKMKLQALCPTKGLFG